MIYVRVLSLGLVAIFLASALLAVSAYGQAQAVPTLRLIGFSTQLAPGDNLACRQALAFGIDRESVAKAVAPHLQRTPRPAVGIQHPALPGYNPGVQGYTYDPERAKNLYTQCGFTGTLRILAGRATNRFLQTYNSSVAESLRKSLGVQVEYNEVANFNVLVQAVKVASAPIWSFAWASDPQDPGYPSFALGIATDLVADPDVKALLAKADVKAVEEMILQRALVIPVIYY